MSLKERLIYKFGLDIQQLNGRGYPCQRRNRQSYFVAFPVARLGCRGRWESWPWISQENVRTSFTVHRVLAGFDLCIL